jgi:hypothetical protein
MNKYEKKFKKIFECWHNIHTDIKFCWLGGCKIIVKEL